MSDQATSPHLHRAAGRVAGRALRRNRFVNASLTAGGRAAHVRIGSQAAIDAYAELASRLHSVAPNVGGERRATAWCAWPRMK